MARSAASQNAMTIANAWEACVARIVVAPQLHRRGVVVEVSGSAEPPCTILI